MPDLLKRLQDEVLVVDGAMGTMLQRAGMPPGQCPEQLNVTNPEMVMRRPPRATSPRAPTASSDQHVRRLARRSSTSTASATGSRSSTAPRCACAQRSGAQHVLGDVGPTRPRHGAARPGDVRRGLRASSPSRSRRWRPSAPTRSRSRRSPTSPRSAARCWPPAPCTDLPVIASMTFGAVRPHRPVRDRPRDRRGRPRGLRRDASSA